MLNLYRVLPMPDYRKCPHCKYDNPSTYYSCAGCARSLDPKQASKLEKVRYSQSSAANRDLDDVTSWLVLSLLLFAMAVGPAFVRWHDIKGTCFTDTARLEKTTGVITSSRTAWRTGGKGRRAFHYDIHYHFKVNNIPYRSNEVTFSQTGSRDRSFAEGYVQQYPVGKTVDVYYERGNPSFSVLEPNTTEVAAWGVLAFLVVSGSASLWLSLIKIAEKRRASKAKSGLAQQA